MKGIKMKAEDCNKEGHWRWEKAPKKRDPTKAFIFFVEPRDLDCKDFDRLQYLADGENSPELSLLQEWFDGSVVTGGYDEIYPKRGDLIQICWLQYRNDGLYIIDKDPNSDEFFVRDLYYEADDYGSIPPDFTLLNFSPSYFDAVTHNFIRWIPADQINPEQFTVTTIRELFPYRNMYEKHKKNEVISLKVDYGEWSSFNVIGVAEFEFDLNIISFREKMIHSFLQELQGIEYKGTTYVCLRSQDPLYGKDPFSEEKNFLYVYCSD